MSRSMPEPVWVLYGTRGCHLCDEAGALLGGAGLRWQAQEIGYDETLTARYGLRIPVLRRPGDGAELDWPFDAAALAGFVAPDGALSCVPRVPGDADLNDGARSRVPGAAMAETTPDTTHVPRKSGRAV